MAGSSLTVVQPPSPSFETAFRRRHCSTTSILQHNTLPAFEFYSNPHDHDMLLNEESFIYMAFPLARFSEVDPTTESHPPI